MAHERKPNANASLSLTVSSRAHLRSERVECMATDVDMRSHRHVASCVQTNATQLPYSVFVSIIGAHSLRRQAKQENEKRKKKQMSDDETHTPACIHAVWVRAVCGDCRWDNRLKCDRRRGIDANTLFYQNSTIECTRAAWQIWKSTSTRLSAPCLLRAIIHQHNVCRRGPSLQPAPPSNTRLHSMRFIWFRYCWLLIANGPEVLILQPTNCGSHVFKLDFSHDTLNGNAASKTLCDDANTFPRPARLAVCVSAEGFLLRIAYPFTKKQKKSFVIHFAVRSTNLQTIAQPRSALGGGAAEFSNATRIPSISAYKIRIDLRRRRRRWRRFENSLTVHQKKRGRQMDVWSIKRNSLWITIHEQTATQFWLMNYDHRSNGRIALHWPRSMNAFHHQSIARWWDESRGACCVCAVIEQTVLCASLHFVYEFSHWNSFSGKLKTKNEVTSIDPEKPPRL